MLTSWRSNPCPLCQSETSVVTDDQPGYLGNNCYRILECEYCDLQFADPMNVPPGLYDIIYRHADQLPGYDRYVGYRDQVRSVARPLEWLATQEPAYWFVKKELAALPQTSSIMEIGSGFGYLTYAIHAAHYNIVGLDISADAVASAQAQFGDLFRCDDLYALASKQPGTFDAVIMTEVIEHVPDLLSFVSAAAALLKPGGRMLITTPNKSYFPLGTCWHTESPPVHLWWFSETAMRRLAEISQLGIGIADFSSIYRPRQEPAAGSRTPARLDDEGQITDAARQWVTERRRSDARFAGLKRYLEPVRPLVRTIIHARRGYPSLAQRSWQMGVTFTKRAAEPAPNLKYTLSESVASS